jgi:hypothetical protein
MISHLVIKTIIARLANHEKFKKIKAKERRKRKQHDQFMANRFGERLYKVSRWIGGTWLLYSCDPALKLPDNVVMLNWYRKIK